MLPILLMIAKIAGIAVLVFLGLLLLIAAAVLLVPVRYGVSGSYYGKPEGTVKITWFLHGVSLKVTYEKELDIVLRVLGKRVFQHRETVGKTKEQTGQPGDGEADDLWGGEEDWPDEDEELRDGEASWPGGADNPRDSAGEPRDGAEALPGRRKNPPEESGPSWGEESPWPEETENSREESGEALGVNFVEGIQEETWQTPELTKDISEPGQDAPGGDTAEQERTDGDQADRAGSGRDKSGKTRRFGFRKKAGKKKKKKDRTGPGAAERIKTLAASIREKWDRLNHYKETAETFWKDEKNQYTIRLILRQVKAVVFHILPTKARGKAVFGFDDPAVTGKVLSVLSLGYTWYGNSVEIVPVFDRKILELEGSLRGRVRAGTILGRGVRILLNKNFRTLLRKWRRSGGRKDGRK